MHADIFCFYKVKLSIFLKWFLYDFERSSSLREYLKFYLSGFPGGPMFLTNVKNSPCNAGGNLFSHSAGARSLKPGRRRVLQPATVSLCEGPSLPTLAPSLAALAVPGCPRLAKLPSRWPLASCLCLRLHLCCPHSPESLLFIRTPVLGLGLTPNPACACVPAQSLSHVWLV